MKKYFEIKPIEYGFGGTFDYICRRLCMSNDALSKAIGFDSDRDRIYKMIFEDISEAAYVKRINKFLEDKNISLRVSCLMFDTKKLRRAFNDRANKKRG